MGHCAQKLEDEMGYTVTEQDIQDIFKNSGSVRNVMLESSRFYASDIFPEISAIRGMREFDPKNHAIRCFLIAICSPQTKFSDNISAARRMHEHLGEVYTTAQDVKDVLECWGDSPYMGSQAQSKYILHSLQAIRSLKPEDMTWDGLWNLRKDRRILGMGAKTISFAIALFDDTSRVFTLDRWMLRGLLWIAGSDLPVGEEVTICKGRYQDLAEFLIQLTEDLAEYPVFLYQWALWNMWRDNTHESHVVAFS